MRSKRPRVAGGTGPKLGRWINFEASQFRACAPAPLGRFDLIWHPVSPHFSIGQFRCCFIPIARLKCSISLEVFWDPTGWPDYLDIYGISVGKMKSLNESFNQLSNEFSRLVCTGTGSVCTKTIRRRCVSISHLICISSPLNKFVKRFTRVVANWA